MTTAQEQLEMMEVALSPSLAAAGYAVLLMNLAIAFALVGRGAASLSAIATVAEAKAVFAYRHGEDGEAEVLREFAQCLRALQRPEDLAVN